MCRLSAITSSDYISPMENILALETMKEGHDGSGLGLMLKDMAGPFADFKQYPTLSAICSNKGLRDLEDYMKAHGEEDLVNDVLTKCPTRAITLVATDKFKPDVQIGDPKLVEFLDSSNLPIVDAQRSKEKAKRPPLR